MLNDEQHKLLYSILDKSLSVLKRQPPTLSITALQILESNSNYNMSPYVTNNMPPIISKHVELQFKESGMYDAFKFLQNLFFHPHPQNRPIGNPYVEQESGMAVYKDEFGKITKEPIGLLGLTLLNDLGTHGTANGATRNDVVTVTKRVILNALTEEELRLRNLTEQAKMLVEPRDRAIKCMETYKQQIAFQQKDWHKMSQIHEYQELHKQSVNQENSGTRPITHEMFQLVRKMCAIELESEQLQSFTTLSATGTGAMGELNRLTVSFSQVVDLLCSADQERDAVSFFDMMLLEFDRQRETQGAPEIFDASHRRQLMNALLCRSYLRHQHNVKDFTGSHRDIDLFVALNERSDAASLLAIYFRAMIFEAQGYYKQALETYTKAIETKGTDQRFASALFRRAVLRRRHFGDIQGAIDDYTNAIRSLPEFAQAYFNRGHLYHYNSVTGAAKDPSTSLGSHSHVLPSDVVLALMNYDMSIALDPRNIAALNSRGILHMSKFRNYAGALQDFEAVLRIDPQNTYAYCNQGCLFHKYMGNREQAMANYDAALRIDPNNISTRYNRATLFHKDLNQPMKALEDYNIIESLDPNHSSALRARAQLFRDLFNDLERYEKDMKKARQIDQNTAKRIKLHNGNENRQMNVD